MKLLKIHGARNLASIAALAVVLGATAALAQFQGGTMRTGDVPGLAGTGADTATANLAINADATMREQFFHAAGINAQMELQLSQLAMTQSSNDEIKKLASQITQEYPQFVNTLNTLAVKNTIAYNASLSKGFHKDLQKLQALKGPAFDQAYLKHLNHDVKSDKNEARSAAPAMDTLDLHQFQIAFITTTMQRLQQISAIAKSENLKIK